MDIAGRLGSRRAFIAILYAAIIAGLGGIATGCNSGFSGVLTFHNDNARDGLNSQETTLTPANVNSTQFGKVFSYPVDGYVYAQPLYVPIVNIPGSGFHNVVYVVTEHDSVYAFDADNSVSTPLWHTSFIDPADGITTVPSTDTGSNDILPEIGITGTPVIDPASRTIYVAAVTKNVNTVTWQWNLHALDLQTGAEKFGGPALIDPTLFGTGANSKNGVITFEALTEGQRCGLLLVNGVVYVAFASHGSVPPYHGLVIAFSASNLNQIGVLDITPDGEDGGIWQSGNGPSSDASGSVYVASGNGTFDFNEEGGLDLGDSAMKLSFSADSGFNVDTYFAPYNAAFDDKEDEDFGDSGVVLFPDQPTGPVHLGVIVGKDANIYLVNRDDMGGFNSVTTDNHQIVQEVIGALAGQARTVPAFFNQTMYLGANNDSLKGFTLSGGQFPSSANVQSSFTFVYPGASPSISANGTKNAIVWALMGDGPQPSHPAVLYAFDPKMNELYDSNQAPANRDQAGNAVKFTVPTIANGRVYIGTQTELDAYGLLPSANERTAK